MGEEIKQGQDLAAILPQRLVELSVLELLRNPEDAIQDHVQVGKKVNNSLILNISNEQIDQSVFLICMFISSGNATKGTKLVRKSVDFIKQIPEKILATRKSWKQNRAVSK